MAAHSLFSHVRGVLAGLVILNNINGRSHYILSYTSQSIRIGFESNALLFVCTK